MWHALRGTEYTLDVDIDKVREETASYVRKLIGEIETVTHRVTSLVTENERLRHELKMTRDELMTREEKEKQLEEKLQEIRTETETYLAQFSELEQHNTNLANLYVATYQLHGTLDRGTVLEAIQEIVVNLIGSEDFAILDRQLTTEPYALALPRNDDDFRLFVDTTLSQLLLTNALQELYAKSFGEPDEQTRAFFRWSMPRQ